MGHPQHHYPALTLTGMTVLSIGLQIGDLATLQLRQSHSFDADYAI